VSLIDLDESLSPKPTTTTQDELAALFGPSLASWNAPPAAPSLAAPIPSNRMGMGMNVNRMASGTPPMQGTIMLPGTPQRQGEEKDPFADLVGLF